MFIFRSAYVIFLCVALSACAELSQIGGTKDAMNGGEISNKVAGTDPQMGMSGDTATYESLYALYWTQQSVEYQAVTETAYRLAGLRLDEGLRNADLTAALEQTGGYRYLPPAVIVDVDETMLDNSAYMGWLAQTGHAFDFESFGLFVNSAISAPIPAALAFANQAAAKGVTVFYVTNRPAVLEEATRENLRKAGFPLTDDWDVVLTQGEKEEWTSDKGTRRAEVAKTHRILLLIGDNFGDFVDGISVSPEARRALLETHRVRFGETWIQLPNPIYGSWEDAASGFDRTLTPSERRARMIEGLRAWNKESPDS